jgi:hypothetical protein
MATATIIKMPGMSVVPAFVPRKERDVMETVFIHPEKLGDWKRPGRIQRPLKLNEYIFQCAREMQLHAAQDPDEAWCEVPGIVTLAKFNGETYLLDGQHRLDGALKLAAGQVIVAGGVPVKVALARVRTIHIDSWTEMADEFGRINGQLVRTKPEDVLRAASMGNVNLQAIERACPFIGYDRAGENKKQVLLTMPTAVRTWLGSAGVVPAQGPTVGELTKYLNKPTTLEVIDFYLACDAAGWQNSVYQRFWGTLNLSINMWLYRRLVLGEHQQRFHGGIKPMILTRAQFVECMRGLTMDADYHEWLSGRTLRERDRVPCYTRLKEISTPILRKMGIEPRFPMAADWGG